MKEYQVYKEVVPYIGTWIETFATMQKQMADMVVPYIGTWIETYYQPLTKLLWRRTLYRYVD